MQNTLGDAAREEGPRYPLNSVDNALKLLMMFRTRDRLRLSEISRELGIANSTAHRLLAMLAYHDLVKVLGSSRVYVPGSVLIEVGLAAARDIDFRYYAQPYLKELAARFNETTHLAVLDGTDVRFLDDIQSTQAVRVAPRDGTSMPAHCTSSGKALLAALPPSAVEGMYAKSDQLAGVTPRSIQTVDQLMHTLELVRQFGYAQSDGESEEGIASVATAVRDSSGTPIAALAIAAPAQRLPPVRRVEMAQALIEAAASLSESLPT